MGAKGTLIWACDRCGVEAIVSVEIPAFGEIEYPWWLPRPEGWELTDPCFDEYPVYESFCPKCWVWTQMYALDKERAKLSAQLEALEDSDE